MASHLPTRLTIAVSAAGVALLAFHASDRPEVAAVRLGRTDPARPRSAELDRRLDAVAARMRVKDGLARDLIEGRAALPDVAARFLAMNAEHPGSMTGLRSRFPGLPDEEMTARVVLEFVELQEGVPAEEKREALARLGDEFNRTFGSRPEYPIPTGDDHVPGPSDRWGKSGRRTHRPMH